MAFDRLRRIANQAVVFRELPSSLRQISVGDVTERVAHLGKAFARFISGSGSTIQKVAQELAHEPSNVKELACGKAKKVLHSSQTPEYVYYSPQPHIFNATEKTIRKESEFTSWIGKKLAEMCGKVETNVATTFEKVGKALWRARKAVGSLEQIFSKPELREQLCRDFGSFVNLGRQFLNGMANLHAIDCMHGDLKPDNMLVDEEGILRVSDFGKGCIVEDGTVKGDYEGNTRFGPPEGQRHKPGDVYGAGICLIRFLEERFLDRDGTPLLDAPRHPTKGKSGVDKLKADESRRGIERYIIEHKDCTRTSEVRAGWPGKILDFVGRLRAKKGLSNAAQKAEARAMKQYVDVLCSKIAKSDHTVATVSLRGLLNDMTHVDPAKRPTMKQALERYNAIFAQPQTQSQIQ